MKFKAYLLRKGKLTVLSNIVWLQFSRDNDDHSMEEDDFAFKLELTSNSELWHFAYMDSSEITTGAFTDEEFQSMVNFREKHKKEILAHKL